MSRADDIDDDDDVPCYRHPRELTALRCATCDRPICVDCGVAAAVGIKCPDCGRTSRAERGALPTNKLVISAAASGTAGLLLGAAHFMFNIPLLSLIIAWLLGRLIGEIARRASGGYRDPIIGRIAVSSSITGFLLPWAPLLIATHGAIWIHHAQGLWALAYAAAAAYGAWRQALD